VKIFTILKLSGITVVSRFFIRIFIRIVKLNSCEKTVCKIRRSCSIALCFFMSFTGKVFSEPISSTPAIGETVILSVHTSQNKIIWPNRAAKSLTTPSGWGASWGVIFVGAGITDPAAYSTEPDVAISFGMGLGNPVTNLGIQLSPTIWDVSKFDNFSLSCKVHRYLGKATSLAIGGENLFADKKKTDTGESYYIVISHAFQNVHSHNPDVSALHASFGIGSGRFDEKSPLDIQSGKGRYGTYVFGSLAYEIFPSANIVIDWNGLNLSAGVALSPFQKIPVGMTLGVADITNYSGDRLRFIASVGYAYQF